MEADFLDMMPHTVTVEPYTGVDSYNAPQYGTGVDYAARVVGKVKLVRNKDGEEVVASKVVYLGADVPSMTPLDRLTLPSEEPKAGQIVAVLRTPDENGGHHTVVYCS